MDVPFPIRKILRISIARDVIERVQLTTSLSFSSISRTYQTGVRFFLSVILRRLGSTENESVLLARREKIVEKRTLSWIRRHVPNSTVCDMRCTYYSSVLLYLYVLIEIIRAPVY